MRRALPIFLLCGCATLQANAVRVGELAPERLVTLPGSPASIKLELAEVPDSYVVPESTAASEVPVELWQATIINGFNACVTPFFTQPRGEPDYVLKFRKATLDYTLGYLENEDQATAAVHARVKYVVEVIYRTGEIVRRIDSEAFSTSAWKVAGGSQATAQEAVSAMYRDIAERGLRTLPKILPAKKFDVAPPGTKPPPPPPIEPPAPADPTQAPLPQQ
jgi:hypothetical protein